MATWEPSVEEKKYLDLVMAVSVDCSLGRGTVDRETYLANLESVIKLLGDVTNN